MITLCHLTLITGPRQELIKTANLLFVQLETSFVWSACGRHFTEASARGGEGEVGWRMEPSTGLTSVCRER